MKIRDKDLSYWDIIL